EESCDQNAHLICRDESLLTLDLQRLVFDRDIESQQPGRLCFQAPLLLRPPEHVVRFLLGALSHLLWRESGVSSEPIQRENRIAKNLFKVADGVTEDSKSLVAAHEHPLFNRPRRNEVVDQHLRTHLPEAVNAPDALLDSHRVPGDVVVHESIAKLVVK